MPAPIFYAHQLCQRQAEVRKENLLPGLRPDGKSQWTFEYHQGRPIGIRCIVLSKQHSPEISQKALQEGGMEMIIKPVLPKEWLSEKTHY